MKPTENNIIVVNPTAQPLTTRKQHFLIFNPGRDTDDADPSTTQFYYFV